MMAQELWEPTKQHERRAKPTTRKWDGGSQFDDEMGLERHAEAKVEAARLELIDHLNHRPDHIVYVGSVEERDKMRTVFNSWFQWKVISHNPTIKIDYGVAEGAIRGTE